MRLMMRVLKKGCAVWYAPDQNYAGKDNISAATRDKYLDLSMKDKKKAIQLTPPTPGVRSASDRIW